MDDLGMSVKTWFNLKKNSQLRVRLEFLFYVIQVRQVEKEVLVSFDRSESM